MRNTVRPRPSDFAEKRLEMTRDELVAHYSTSPRTLRRWMAEVGIRNPRQPNAIYHRRPVPDDFAQVAPTMLKGELREHYRTSQEVLSRWLAETGVQTKAYTPPVGVINSMGRVHKVNLAGQRVRSVYDDAADDLRRERFLVNRCNEKGGFDPKGAFWRVGWSICTPDELLARAAKYRRAA